MRPRGDALTWAFSASRVRRSGFRDSLLGPGRVFSYPIAESLHYQTDGLAVAFTFIEGACVELEFKGARQFPPTLFGRRLAGPTMRAEAEVLIERGLEAYNEYGLITDLVKACTPPSPDEGNGPDTIWFPDIGVCLWTDYDTQTGYGEEDLGEFVLETVSVWPRGRSPQLGI